MEESKLSMLQRKSIQNAVNRGESLPPISRSSSAPVNHTRVILFLLIILILTNNSIIFVKNESCMAIYDSPVFGLI